MATKFSFNWFVFCLFFYLWGEEETGLERKRVLAADINHASWVGH